jgi:hypothetical protein
MSVDRIQLKRPGPNFKLEMLPEPERIEAGSIRMNLGALHSRATSFWAARTLFQNLAERQLFDPLNGGTYHEWQLCAARDGVMSIYHFGQVIDGIDQSLGACPALRNLIDTKAKRVARKRFEQDFPSHTKLRHAIAHSAERSGTLRDAQRHGAVRKKTLQVNPVMAITVGDDATMLLLNDSIYGTTFTSMWDGQLVQCDIHDSNGVLLDQIVDAYWAAFDKIIDPNPEAPPKITVSSKPQL